MKKIPKEIMYGIVFVIVCFILVWAKDLSISKEYSKFQDEMPLTQSRISLLEKQEDRTEKIIDSIMPSALTDYHWDRFQGVSVNQESDSQ